MHIEAWLLRATHVDLPLTTGMAAVLLCTVHGACTLDLPDPRLHRSQASTRDRLLRATGLYAFDQFDFQASIRDVLVCKPGFYPRLYGMHICTLSVCVTCLTKLTNGPETRSTVSCTHACTHCGLILQCCKCCDWKCQHAFLLVLVVFRDRRKGGGGGGYQGRICLRRVNHYARIRTVTSQQGTCKDYMVGPVC